MKGVHTEGEGSRLNVDSFGGGGVKDRPDVRIIYY